MKKIVACIISLLILTSVVSAETIGKRIFEIKVDADVTATNNAFGISEFFQEEAVIDLPKIYKELPKKGFVTGFSEETNIALSLNILGVKAGFETGLDGNVTLGLSKDLFKFLGQGNKINEPMEFTSNSQVDLFAYFKTPVSFKVQGISISATPSIFIPLVHAEMGKSGATITNTEEGTIKIDGLYSLLVESGIDAGIIETGEFPESPSSILGTSGFDLALGVKVPLFLGLQVTGDVHLPVVPGKLVSKVETSGDFSCAINLMNPDENSPFNMNTGDIEIGTHTGSINRPLTMMAGVEWKPLLDMVKIDGSIGCGVRYPFSKRAYFYPQYHAGASISLLRILGASVSTEYINEMFRHEAGMMFNVRALEIDTGVSLAGSDFKNSLRGKGFGAYITFCFGF